MWVDPPYYFDGIVYPAYVKAFGHLFEGGDVEHGDLQPSTTSATTSGSTTPDPSEAPANVTGLILMDALKISADELLEWSCRELMSHLEERTSAAVVF